MGYGFAFKGGLSSSLGDIIIPPKKEQMIVMNKQAEGIIANYNAIDDATMKGTTVMTRTSANATLTNRQTKTLAPTRIQFGIYDVGLGSTRLQRTNSTADWNARIDGQAQKIQCGWWRDHRKPDSVQL